MIAASRFIETSDNYVAWLAARLPAVTATEVAKAATPAGFREAVQNRRNPQPVTDNAYMKFGRDNEGWIAGWVKAEFGIMPNHWLIAAADNPLHLATPDGLSLDHMRIGEIKTGGTEPKSPPAQHRRQVQWQLRCTDAESCIYAFMLRQEVHGIFVPAWMEPKTWVIERDEKEIALLERTAELLLENEGQVAA
ncbi:MAG: hypothetical protein ABI400_02775 [Lacisediminihabitans sp.]